MRLIVIVLAGALVWMIWWAFGQGAYEKGLNAWIEDRRAEGWVADLGELNTAGFPNRFDTTLMDVHLADPDTGIAWTAPKMQFLSLAYKPHQVIAVLPDGHKFSTPFDTFDITHDDARASLFLKPGTTLALDRARLVIDTLQVNSSADRLALAEGRFAAESVAATTDTYRVGAEILTLTPTEATKALLDPGGLLPESVETLRLDADLAFDRPWDRRAVEASRPQLTAIDLTDLSARWGNITFRAAGELTVNQGIPEGAITVRAVEWRKLLAMAFSAGWLPQSAVGPLESGLELLSGRTDTLDAELQFSQGSIWLGPIPLGPAPDLSIR